MICQVFLSCARYSLAVWAEWFKHWQQEHLPIHPVQNHRVVFNKLYLAIQLWGFGRARRTRWYKRNLKRFEWSKQISKDMNELYKSQKIWMIYQFKTQTARAIFLKCEGSLMQNHLVMVRSHSSHIWDATWKRYELQKGECVDCCGIGCLTKLYFLHLCVGS